MKTHTASLVCALYGATLLLLATPASAEPNGPRCRLANLAISIGMSRAEVERAVAAALGAPSRYSPFANNLEGGSVEYVSDHCTLKVEFSAGAPAPRISLPSGQTEHLQPKDERVLAYKLLFDRPGVASAATPASRK